MPEIEHPSYDILVVRLSQYHSLDLVRIPTTQKYRIVMAERLGVQRRAFVEISYEDAREIAKFLGNGHDTAVIVDPAPQDP
jgi:hypothetical protein